MDEKNTTSAKTALSTRITVITTVIITGHPVVLWPGPILLPIEAEDK